MAELVTRSDVTDGRDVTAARAVSAKKGRNRVPSL